MEEILRVEGLSKTFTLSKKQQKIERTTVRKKVAVDNLSFTAYRGEIFGLLGPNGAGKTTTLRMLATLIKPDSGDAVLEGYSVVQQEEEVRSRIAFLTSELKLEDFFTPNYLYDFFSRLHGVPEHEAAERKRAMFERFGIDKFAEVKVQNLSTGMKQKASIVISLAHNPDIIIFDEPTNGLDIPSKTLFRQVIAKHANDDRTIIISTHQVKDVENLIDPIIILDHDEVLLKASFRDITDRLYFDYGMEKDDIALYSEMIPGGYVNVTRNPEGLDSKVSIEVLFNTVMKNKETIKQLFS